MKIKLIKFEKFYKAPYRAHYNDAGADCYVPETVTIPPHSTVAIGLGFGVKLPDGVAAYVIPRSGTAKKGIVTQIPPVDSGYTGEIHAITSNLTDEPYTVNKGDRIGQLVIMPIIVADFVEELGEERGDGAFNSTGK